MRLSVGTQLAVATVAVLVLVTAFLLVLQGKRERTRTIESKREAATMVTELFSASVSAGVVFNDDDAVRAVLDNLKQTEDVVGGGVYPVAVGTKPSSFGVEMTGVASHGVASHGVAIEGDTLIVSHDIIDVERNAVGLARVAFSLAPEERRLARNQREAMLYGLVILVAVASVLIGITRLRIVRPLKRLAEAAKSIEDGNLNARAPEQGDLEIATLARAFNSMGNAIAERERALKKELEVAAVLQTSVLPKNLTVRGAEIAAVMTPATEVGGDYYDVLPTDDGCWLGIGDVSGHGLGAGVVMLMIQAAVSALVAAKPDASPVEVECVVNRVLYENIRERMGRRDHATLSIIRYHEDGTVRFAGAHEDIIVYRAASGVVEGVETPGTWVGARKSIDSVTEETSIRLEPGDFLVLYTDGVTEARRNGEQFGFDRLLETVRCAAAHSATGIRDAVTGAVAAWTSTQTDDVTVVVFRQLERLPG